MDISILMRFKDIASRFRLSAVLLPPFLLYLYVCQDFVNGHITLNMDSAAHYCFTKYFVNCLLNGIMPLWEPFVYSGRPFLALINGGMLNPFINLVPLGVLYGLNYYESYLVFILFYYFLGLLGFFQLSRIIIKNDFFSYIGYIALTFSGMGLMVFNQMYVLLIFVPSVWFFVFFLRFLKRFQSRDFLGVILSAMIMEVSYYPFYLMTVFIVFVFFGMLYYLDVVGFKARKLLAFFRRNKAVVAIGLLGICLTSVPLVLYKLRDNKGEVVSPCRHIGCKKNIMDACLKNSELTFRDVGFEGTLGERIDFKDMFTAPRALRYLSDDFFYVPIFCFLIIFLSAFNFLDRSRKVVLLVGSVTFMISLGGITPLHQFLFNHVYFFKYFRNFFFFMAYLIPLTIIFSMLQLKSLLEDCFWNKYIKVALILVLHYIFLMVALSQGVNLPTSLLTVALSMVFFVYYFFNNGEMKWASFIIIILLLLQPLEMFIQYRDNAAALKLTGPFQSDHKKLIFNFQRPNFSISKNLIFKIRDFNFDAMLDMKDSSGGYDVDPDSVSRWHFILLKRISGPHILKYLKNKFYLYENVIPYNMDDDDVLEYVRKPITNGGDQVFIFDKSLNKGEISNEVNRAVTSNAEIIRQNSLDFSVVDFQPNELSIDYKLEKPRFLLYTDNFNSDWKVYIDSVKKELVRSNVAFKGVMLPAGTHKLKFICHPVGGTLIYWFSAFFMFVLLGVLCFVSLKMNPGFKNTELRKFFGFRTFNVSKDFSCVDISGFYYFIIFIFCMVQINLFDLTLLHKTFVKHEKNIIRLLNK
jgi:hypothetical protein